ncbi:MAG: FHA domain-containing protein [Planctomycetaceae bacterium]
MPMFLVPLDEGPALPLDKAIVFIGRHPDCDVVLTNSRKVSRKHCCVSQINNGFVVRDLGSMNGVRVNDTISRDELPLRPGDELWVGDTGFRMEFRQAPPKQPKAKTAPAVAEKPAIAPQKENRPFIPEDGPIPIAEEGADFVVEETRPRMKRPLIERSEIIELGDSDIVDESTCG